MIDEENPLTSPFWRTWMLWARVRYTYFVFLVLIFVIVFAMSVMMEVFFIMFMPSSQSEDGYSLTFSYSIIAFPLILLGFAWIFDEVADLLVDCATDAGGSMPKFRACQVTIVHALRNWRYFYGGGDGSNGGNTAYEPVDEGSELELKDIPLEVGEFMNEDDKALVQSAIDHPYEGPKLLPSSYAPVDFLQPFLFDALILAGLIAGWVIGGSASTGIIAVIQGGFIVAFGYCMLWALLDIIVTLNKKTRRFFRYLKARQAVINYKVLEMRLAEDSEVIGYALALRVGSAIGCKRCVEHPAAHAHVGDHHKQMLSDNTWFLISLVLYAIACAVSLAYVMVGFYLLMLSMWLLAYVVEKKSSGVLGSKFRYFLAAFVVLTSALFTFVAVVGASDASVVLDTVVLPPTTTSTRARSRELTSYNPFQVATITPRYTVCAGDFSGLTIIDFGLLAQAAYTVENATYFEDLVQDRFSGTATLGDVSTVKVDATSFVKFAEVYFEGIDTTVITVRGTTTAMDALEDMHYWFGIGFLQTLSKVMLPIIEQLPETFVCWMLYLAGLNNMGPTPIYEYLVSYVEERKEALCGSSSSSGENCRLYVTGHSLGGGMAALAGARAGVNAISFSGPGIRFLRYRFDVDDDDIKNYVLTVMPESDLVPQVDALDGLTQKIKCTAGDAISCHSIGLSTCTLYNSCGDYHDRDWSGAGC